MDSILVIGIIVFTGFICGEIAEKVRLPKVTGYIIAGLLMNPDIVSFVPKAFPDQTDVVTNIALAFITFSIGGSLYYPAVKKLGKGIIFITLCEAEFAFFAIITGFLIILPFFTNIPGATWTATFIPIAVLIGSLGSPTDPSATLAVKQEYKPHGEVSSTMLSVAAFDDVLGIVNYSIAIVVAQALIVHQPFSITQTVMKPALIILGSLVLGSVLGYIFNFITHIIDRETEGVLIMVLFGFLTLCFGGATALGADELLSVMTMGAVVVNFNRKREKIFKVLERYVDELVFVLFFTLSGMHLNFTVLFSSTVIIIFFVVFRAMGKFCGTFLGATIAGSSSNVKKYTAWGLIPQGGIVIGLALMMRQDPSFSSISDIIISVIIGTTVIHEFVGPILAKRALKGAGEITERK